MKISRYPSARKYQFFPSHSIWFNVSGNVVTGENSAYDGDANVFQHQVQIRSISGGVVAKVIQDVVPTNIRRTDSHKLDLPRCWPVLRLRLGDFVGGFGFQIHIMKSPLNADDVLFDVASGPHNPIL